MKEAQRARHSPEGLHLCAELGGVRGGRELAPRLQIRVGEKELDMEKDGNREVTKWLCVCVREREQQRN